MSATATTIANDRVAIDLGEDGVAEVRFVRGDKMNALDPEMFQRIIEAGSTLQRMKGLRAVVLSGEGRAFCAGLDLSNFSRKPAEDEPSLTERTYGNANRPQQVAMQWRKLPVPVIAAVHGVCFGGGLQIASGADASYDGIGRGPGFFYLTGVPTAGKTLDELEKALRREQARLLQRVFGEMGEEAVQGWLAVNHALARSRQERT